MLNHVRTLLLNRDGDNTPGADFPGEQAVPVAYRELELPAYLDSVRARLFGATPDRAMLNYRLWQYMTVLHATELGDYVLDYDERVTYLGSTRTELFDPATFRPAVLPLTGSPEAELHIQGSGDSPDASGRMRFDIAIDILTSSTVQVQQKTPPAQSDVYTFTFTGGLSDRQPLGDTGYGFLLSTNGPGYSWQVTGYNRPTYELGDIEMSLRGIGEPTILQLFGVNPSEPLKTFRNLWQNHTEMPYRLGGLLLAVAHRTEQVRRRENG